tara:strand:- start:1290 stop:2192 length:903 start_codon:yes stop_codon:yes gene_type:complete
MPKKATYALLSALFACLLWSGNFYVARDMHSNIAPFTLAFWRWLVALIIIIPFAYKHIPNHWETVKHHKWYFLVMGIVGVGMFNTIIYIAAHHTTTYHIALISSIAPIGTIVIAGLCKIEPLNTPKILGGIIALAGALVIITNGKLMSIAHQIWNQGDLLLLLSTTIWAAWSVGAKFKPQTMPLTMFLCTIIVIGVIALLPFYLWEVNNGHATPFDVKSVSIYLYLGMCASLLAWACWQYAIDTIGSVKTSLIYYTMPIFSGILASLLLGESFMSYHAIGFLFVVTGIIVSNNMFKKIMA